jgi:hypothetical protein
VFTILCAGLCLASPPAEDKPALALTIKLDKQAYRPGDEVALTFELKNVSDKNLWIGEGWLAPDTNEIGPGRHFELDVRDEDETRFRYWGPVLTEGPTSGIRKVFLLKAGETFKGAFAVSAGSLATIKTDKPHKLGVDSKNYTLRLVYQVDPKTHGVYMPPKEFDPEKLWKGKLVSNEVELNFK